jgi:hypothetical protein
MFGEGTLPVVFAVGAAVRGLYMDLHTYLLRASPEEWHQVAWSWNWDNSNEELLWIIRQPTCDRGTTLLVYWYGTPRYFAQYATRDDVPAYELEDYDMEMEIERRYLTGAYTRQEIAFDPHDDYGATEQGYDWTLDYADLPNRRPLPEPMEVASPGHLLGRDPAFEDGSPPGVEAEADLEGEGEA